MKFCSVASTKGVIPALIKDWRDVLFPVPLSPIRRILGAGIEVKFCDELPVEDDTAGWAEATFIWPGNGVTDIWGS
jgi:hypothetical protein